MAIIITGERKNAELAAQIEADLGMVPGHEEEITVPIKGLGFLSLRGATKTTEEKTVKPKTDYSNFVMPRSRK